MVKLLKQKQKSKSIENGLDVLFVNQHKIQNASSLKMETYFRVYLNDNECKFNINNQLDDDKIQALNERFFHDKNHLMRSFQLNCNAIAFLPYTISVVLLIMCALINYVKTNK